MSSFFGNSNQGGEIWSMAGIDFGSHLPDILEKDDFTLEELLVEDELLQEIKSRNPTLLDFLSSSAAVSAMVDYVTFKPGEGADEMTVFKYPYMSCELFCCEVPSILQRLVEEEDGRHFTQLLAALDSPLPLDHYLAGYLEKILDMLFRQMTLPVMRYLNRGGICIFRKFLTHIDNYSIMQIVQRLMLPHIPFSLETSDVETMTPEQRENCTCDWSFLPETCGLLLARMLEPACHPDIPAHISELLITVIQLSPPDAPFLSNLCEENRLQSLVTHIWNPACVDDIAPGPAAEAEAARDSAEVRTAKSLAAASVLDSLMSRMCEAYDPSFVPPVDGDSDGELKTSRSNSFDEQSPGHTPNPMLVAASRMADGNQSGDFSVISDALFHLQVQQRVRENMGYICRDIMGMIPKLAAMLQSHLRDPPATLRAVCARQAEAAADSEAPAATEESDEADSPNSDAAVDLEQSSDGMSAGVPEPEGFIMHQTKFPFARLGPHGFRLVKLTESIVRLADPAVDEALVSSGALGACIDLMFQYELHSLLHLSVQRIAVMILEGGESRRLAQKNILIDVGLIDHIVKSFDRKSDLEDNWNGNSNRFAGCGKPVLGHAICMAQVLVRMLHMETPEGIREARDILEDSMLSGVTADGDGHLDGHEAARARTASGGEDIWSVVEGAPMGHQGLPRSLPATLLRTIIEAGGAAERWDAFVDNEYKRATDLQMTGATDSAASVYSASDAGGGDAEDAAQVHMDNALRAMAGYSGFDGNLANRWPAADADFVIINDEEDDEDDDEDYPYDWNPARQGANDFTHAFKHGHAQGHAQGGGARHAAHAADDGAVMVEEDNGYQNFDDSGSDDGHDSDDAGGWTNVGAGQSGEDVFGPSGGGVDIFDTEGAANTGTDFFSSSPSSASSGSEGSPTPASGSDFFADFGSPAAAPAQADAEDLFAAAPAAGGEEESRSDFFGDSNSAFSFSSQPAPVGSAVQPSPTSDDTDAPKGNAILYMYIEI
jgi:hypothetical protein